jgi:hypothetical protein
MEKILIIDTETVGLEKCYAYDIGYIIASLNNEGFYTAIEKKQFIIDQVYNNHMLFETSYYANKRPKYVSLLKGRKARLKKMGHALMIMRNDIDRYGVEIWGAYNAPFDTKVMKFNAEKFNLVNPIEHLPRFDIMNVANEFIHQTSEYKEFCNDNDYVGESGLIKTNAEITFRFISGQKEFIEEHTGLQDCEIELDILNYCMIKGADLKETYKRQFIKSNTTQKFRVIIKDKDGNEKFYNFNYTKKINSKKRNAIVLEK